MRILVLSEGNTDIRPGEHETVRGVVGVLVQGLVARHLNVPRERVAITGGRLPRLHRRRGGFVNKVAQAIRDHTGKFDGLAIVVDRGGPENRDRIRLLQEGRDSGQEALAHRTAVGVAIEEIEAWLLADSGALSAVLGGVGAAPDPESLSDPKALLTERARDCDLSPGEYCDKIANHANLDTIAKTCRAFEDFAKEVRDRICKN